MSERQSDWDELESWQRVKARAEQLVNEEDFSAISIQAFCGTVSPCLQFGRQTESTEINDNTLFLAASLTKPIVAALVLKLVEQGVISLNERVSSILPEWNTGEKRRITIRHLLCHASGLVDQVQDNLKLRNEHAPLDEFYQAAIKEPLLFPPGAGSQYQSMGFLVLWRLVEQLTFKPFPEVIHEIIFRPLSMDDSFLGFDERVDVSSVLDRVADVTLPEEMLDCSGNWNSEYWRMLGAPWGGMLSNTSDLLKFCREMLLASHGHGALIAWDTFFEMVRNQLDDFEQMPDRERRHRSWGLGWRHNWKTHAETFGDTLPADAIGHWGATGCVMWVEPTMESAAVILTTKPSTLSRVQLVRLSNMVHIATQEMASRD